MEEIRFYRASGEYGFLSNLFPRPIVFEGIKFSSSEAAYQYGKAKDKKVAEWIVSAPKQHLIAMAGHGLLSWDIVPEWSQKKNKRMWLVLKEKFAQHEDLKEKLLSTGRKKLIEDSPTDSYWGCGKNGKGKNMLGELLMLLREEIIFWADVKDKGK